MSKNFRPVLHNCISHVFWNLWRKNTFCTTFSFSFRFRTLSETFSTFYRKVFVGFVKTATYMSLQLFGGRTGACKTFFVIFFRYWAKTSDLFSRSFRRVCQNCILHVFKNNWRKHTFSVKILNFSINLGLGAKKFRPFVEKFSSGLSQLPPTGPQEHLEEEYFFLDFF